MGLQHFFVSFNQKGCRTITAMHGDSGGAKELEQLQAREFKTAANAQDTDTNNDVEDQQQWTQTMA